MRLAAIADVHGNRFALEVVLADIAANSIREVVNLGDHVGGPLEAARTADILMERGFPSVRGDQDRQLVELRRYGTSPHGDFRQLDRGHFDWMARMPPTLVDADDVFLCHGTPQDDAGFWLDYVAPDGSAPKSTIEAIESEARGIDASLILCGHTHIPRVVRLGDGRMIVNPGSVGLPDCPAMAERLRYPTRWRSAHPMHATPLSSAFRAAGQRRSDMCLMTTRPQPRWRVLTV
jgi:predicted phosphodiesterase